MASKKKTAPQWREGDACVLHGRVTKVIGEDGREKLAVLLDGALQSFPVLFVQDKVVRAPQ
jgi:hypothetical protein